MALNIHIPPPVQHISISEAQHGGAGTRKTLTESELKKTKSFIQAHAQKPETPNQNFADAKKSNQVGKPQVSSEEQALAVAAKGRTDLDDKKQNREKFQHIYKKLFAASDSFLNKDLDSLQNAITKNSKCLVDRAKLKPKEKALRKYLLTSIALEQSDLSKSDALQLTNFRQKQIEAHGDYITGTLTAFEKGEEAKLEGISLREFIKAYTVIEMQEKTDLSDLFNLFKSIKRNLNKQDYSKEIIKMRDSLIDCLVREKTQTPKKITGPRHYLILSRLKKLDTLIKAQALHKKFLECCTKAKIEGLPELSFLMEVCIQIISTSEVLPGLNNLIRIASAVKSDNLPAGNTFITNFNRQILQHDLLKNLYKNGSHRKQIIDGIDKNTKAAGILAVGAQNAPA